MKMLKIRSAVLLATRESAETVHGRSIAFDTREGVKVNDATAIQDDIEASNGVIYVMDTVLIP